MGRFAADFTLYNRGSGFHDETNNTCTTTSTPQDEMSPETKYCGLPSLDKTKAQQPLERECYSNEAKTLHHECPLCKSEVVAGEVVDHVQTCHLDDITCHACGRHFFLERSLTQHLKESHEEEVLKCEFCKENTNFQSLILFLQHQVTAHPNIQEQDIKRETNKDQYEREDKSSTAKRPLNQTKERARKKNYTCSKCEQPFALKSQMLAHHRISLCGNIHSCRFCSLGFTSFTQRWIHENKSCTFNPKLALKKYKCSKCAIRFVRESNLSLHKKTCKKKRVGKVMSNNLKPAPYPQKLRSSQDVKYSRGSASSTGIVHKKSSSIASSPEVNQRPPKKESVEKCKESVLNLKSSGLISSQVVSNPKASPTCRSKILNEKSSPKPNSLSLRKGVCKKENLGKAGEDAAVILKAAGSLDKPLRTQTVNPCKSSPVSTSEVLRKTSSSKVSGPSLLMSACRKNKLQITEEMVVINNITATGSLRKPNKSQVVKSSQNLPSPPSEGQRGKLSGKGKPQKTEGKKNRSKTFKCCHCESRFRSQDAKIKHENEVCTQIRQMPRKLKF